MAAYTVNSSNHPKMDIPVQYGEDPGSFWVEYPSGLVDLTRTRKLQDDGQPLELDMEKQVEFPVDGDRILRVQKDRTALVIIDMQNYFLHPDLRDHPLGLKCVNPTLQMIDILRTKGVKIIWVNWGLTEYELKTIPPSLVRGFAKRGGFGSNLSNNWGRLLMRGERNSDLYEPLQASYIKGQQAGTDVWIHKNRMSALWGNQTSLDLYLKENGITTLLLSGVNTDQCVGGTLVDGYYLGYDIILVTDATATTSPEGGYENFVYNTANLWFHNRQQEDFSDVLERNNKQSE